MHRTRKYSKNAAFRAENIKNVRNFPFYFTSYKLEWHADALVYVHTVTLECRHSLFILTSAVRKNLLLSS